MSDQQAQAATSTGDAGTGAQAAQQDQQRQAQPQSQQSQAQQSTQAPQSAQDVFPREYVEKIRQEAASARTDLKALKDEFTAFKNEHSTKQAEAERKAQEAERKAQRLAIRSAFVTAATKHGIVHVEDAYKLADFGAVEFDQESGETKGIEDAVKALVKDKPFLLRTGDGVSATNAPRGAAGNSAAEQMKATAKYSGADALSSGGGVAWGTGSQV